MRRQEQRVVIVIGLECEPPRRERERERVGVVWWRLRPPSFGLMLIKK
jgi:hypothetical protein